MAADAEGPNAPILALSAMEAEHNRLVQDSRSGATLELIDRATKFLERGVEVGNYLDDPDDRRVAQGFLDYWKGAVYSYYSKKAREDAEKAREQARKAREAGQKTSVRATPTPSPTPQLPIAILADYIDAPVEKLCRAADAELDRMPPTDQELARRLLTQFVHLDHNRPTFTLISLPRPTLETNRDPAQVERVLATLVTSGVVRKTAGKTPAEDRFELAAEPLLRNWMRLKGWLDRRLALRTAAECWASDHKSCSLLSGQGLADATDYQDKNPAENEFVEASRGVAQRQQRNWYVSLGIAALVLIGGLTTLLVLLLWNQRIERRQRELENKQTQDKQAYEDDLKAQKEMLEKERRTKAERIALCTRLVRLVGNHVVATDTEMELADWEWDEFLNQMKEMAEKGEDRWVYDFLNDHKADLAAIQSRAGILNADRRRQRGLAALRLVHALRRRAIEGDARDPDIIKLMTSVRTASYRQAERVATELVTAARDQRSFNDVQPILKEFWRLYWSSLGWVENYDVASAMQEFSGPLTKWENLAYGRQVIEKIQSSIFQWAGQSKPTWADNQGNQRVGILKDIHQELAPLLPKLVAELKKNESEILLAGSDEQW